MGPLKTCLSRFLYPLSSCSEHHCIVNGALRPGISALGWPLRSFVQRRLSHRTLGAMLSRRDLKGQRIVCGSHVSHQALLRDLVKTAENSVLYPGI